MKTLFGIFNDDRVNKYNMQFSVSALESALRQHWKLGLPSYVNHDRHLPAGWAIPRFLLFQPSCVRLLGELLTPENDKEMGLLQEKMASFVIPSSDIWNEELRWLNESVKAIYQGPLKQFVEPYAVLEGNRIAQLMLPNIFNEQDADYLVSYNELSVIGPGVFASGNFILFAHRFFRRSLSSLNDLNQPFLSLLAEIARDPSLRVRIRLDPDLIGVRSTYREVIELEYWWGPKFDDDLASIPNGVSRYQADERTVAYYGISATEFWWHEQNEQKTLECEELLNRPSCGIGNERYGCRYVHSIIEKGTNSSFHLDGAVRIYDTDAMLERLEEPINKAGRNTDYNKLWRIDGSLSVEKWKALISHYFRGNRLVGEYFDGKETLNVMAPAPEEQTAELSGEGLFSETRDVTVSLFYLEKMNGGAGRFINPCDTILVDGEKRPYIEFASVELRKLLGKKGKTLDLPQNCVLVAFEDLVFNLPLIQHQGGLAWELAEETLESIHRFCQILLRGGDDRVVSYSLAVEYENLVGGFSFSGHVSKLVRWHRLSSCSLPRTEEELSGWSERVARCLHEESQAEGISTQIDIAAYRSGIIQVDRKKDAPPKSLPVPVWIIKASTCSLCNKDYADCLCSTFADEGCTQIVTESKCLGHFYTSRPA